MMSRGKIWTLVFVLSIFPFGAALADVRAQHVCFPSFSFTEVQRIIDTGVCFSGSEHTCWVGVRGDWLDLTGSVSHVSGPTATIEIVAKGVEDSGAIGGDCIPRSNKDREGFVRLHLKNINGAGTMRLRLNRVGGQDTISVTIRDGRTFLSKKLEPRFTTARAGEAKVFELEGSGLGKLQLKGSSSRLQSGSGLSSSAPVNNDLRGIGVGRDEILSKTTTTARVRLTFSTVGTISLRDKLAFSDGEPALNQKFGWPEVNVSAGAGGQNPPPPPPRDNTDGGSGGNIIQDDRPNLTPQQPSIAPLLKKLGSLKATKIDSRHCPSSSQDQEVEVDVPAFDWGVANDDRSAVNTPFTVTLLDGDTNRPLATETVQNIGESSTRIFRNWPGRPARVKVIFVTAANPDFADYDRSPGCYIATALVSSTKLDPQSLIVRVDSGGPNNTGVIAERVENDNDLVRR